MNDFESVRQWCRQYLERQYSRDIGRHFGDILQSLGGIAHAPQDSVDRFDWLKQQEADVFAHLQSLVDSFAALMEEQQRAAQARGAVRATGGTSRLFVYGTLKRGYRRSGALEAQRFIGLARTLPCYRMYDCGGYPALIATAEAGVAIEGELWEVDDRCLEDLDEIEGVHLKLYERRPVLLDEPYQSQTAESYFYCRDVSGRRDCGSCWE